MTKDEALKLALEALKQIDEAMPFPVAKLAQSVIKEALAQPEQEPVAWEGGEGWESLAWELCADENGEDSCNELIWEGGPIPEPWGDRWMKYEEEAKRLIALVQKHTTPPQRTWVRLTDEDISEIVRGTHNTGSFVRAIENKLKAKNT